MKSITAADLPQLTTAQMIEVDRLMIEKWQISLIQMMENAGRNLAALARHLFRRVCSRETGDPSKRNGE